VAHVDVISSTFYSSCALHACMTRPICLLAETRLTENVKINSRWHKFGQKRHSNRPRTKTTQNG